MPDRTAGEIIRRQDPATLPVTATVQMAFKVMRNRRIGAVLEWRRIENPLRRL